MPLGKYILGKYILGDDGRTPERCDDLMRWATWFETADRAVKKEQVGEAEVSTVFLGLDHSFRPGGPPLLFETMVFGGPHDGHQLRCSTWVEAVEQHERTVAMVLHHPAT